MTNRARPLNNDGIADHPLTRPTRQVYVQESYERLVRSLLDLPRKPAVLNLQ